MAADRPPLLFPRSSRLKQSRDFATLRQQGQRLVKGCLIANWRILPEGAKSRVGIIASRKLGPAVARNRARRLLRETFRLHQYDLSSSVTMVLVATPSIVGKGLADVERDFLGTMRRARLLKDP
jgi:ribonuclease P protein component